MQVSKSSLSRFMLCLSLPHREGKIMILTRAFFSGLALTTLLCLAPIANASIIEFTVSLSGAEEVAAGDPNGSGLAIFLIDDVALTIDWTITASDISAITGLHIHQADAGVNGPVVVDFGGQLTGSSLLDPDLANVLADPTNFYVNLHTTEFPGGALRGQFGLAAVPEPATLGLMGLGIAALSLWRRRTARSV